MLVFGIKLTLMTRETFVQLIYPLFMISTADSRITFGGSNILLSGEVDAGKPVAFRVVQPNPNSVVHRTAPLDGP